MAKPVCDRQAYKNNNLTTRWAGSARQAKISNETTTYQSTRTCFQASHKGCNLKPIPSLLLFQHLQLVVENHQLAVDIHDGWMLSGIADKQFAALHFKVSDLFLDL